METHLSKPAATFDPIEAGDALPCMHEHSVSTGLIALSVLLCQMLSGQSRGVSKWAPLAPVLPYVFLLLCAHQQEQQAQGTKDLGVASKLLSQVVSRLDRLSTCRWLSPHQAWRGVIAAMWTGLLNANPPAHVLICCEGSNLSQLPYGKALYSYEGKEPGDLKFNKGDIIILRRKVDENWYHGELHGTHGFLPASYIQCVRPLPQAPPQGKALYDFEMKDRDQDKDCLTFTKDEVLTVIRRVDDNWAEGMLGDKIGIFPLLYVELNDSAKQLIEMDKPCPTAAAATASGCDSPLLSDPGAGASMAPGPTLSSSGAVSAFQRRVDGKKNAKKRHSFTALSVTHKSSQAASHRHSMEISAPVLISSSDPRAAARIGELAHLSCAAPTQDSSSAGPIPTAAPRTAAVAGEQGTSPKVQLPLNV
ncbi:SH3 domain-containing RING finger protein 3 [Marmota monax]|uniref:SH3 domain-containing RING finger protein 3 n=1 Tax=Marmota monax TaxID=9995 RepID=A0A834UUI9_MARMO|nr:SH3 domain-containing RING finger protein 3 [Marmota monax]